LKRSTTCATVLLLGAAALAGCGGDKQKVAFRVNKDTVTEEAFNQRVRNVNAANLQLSAQINGPIRAGEFAIQSMIYESILSQLADEKKATPTDAQINAYVPFAKKWQQFPPITLMAGDPFRTEADWRRDAKLALIRRNIVIPALKLTEAEIKSTYDKIKGQITPKDQYHLRVIDVKTRDKAQKALEALKKVAFETVALTQSEDPQSRAANGDIGTMPADALPQSFVAAVKDLKPGQHTPQVVQAEAPRRDVPPGPDGRPQMENRFFILQLVNKIPGKTPTLEEARMVAESALLQQKDQGALQRLQQSIDDFRKKANIQINIPEYKNVLDKPTTPAAPPAMPPAGAPGG
jgi:parvulin-like peptidyl-prolyl isomerase